MNRVSELGIKGLEEPVMQPAEPRVTLAHAAASNQESWFWMNYPVTPSHWLRATLVTAPIDWPQAKSACQTSHSTHPSWRVHR